MSQPSCVVEFDDIPENIHAQVYSSGDDGYDIIVVPTKSSRDKGILKQEMSMRSVEWESFVVAKLSHSAEDVDSEVEQVRRTAQIGLSQELSAVSYLGLKAVILQLKSAKSYNLARMISNKLDLEPSYGFEVWVEVRTDSWDWWNTFRLMTASSKLKVCLCLTSQCPTQLQRERWLGEPLAAIKVPGSLFYEGQQGLPVLSREWGDLLRDFSRLDPKIIVTHLDRCDEMKVYQEYLAHLYQQFPPRDLGDMSPDSLKLVKEEKCDSWYEVLEGDTAKYDKYQEALTAALADQVTEGKVEGKVVVLVVGAGRGRLVRDVMAAGERSGREVTVLAVEQDEFALRSLQSSWADKVKVISSLDVEDRVDILVSELTETQLVAEWLDKAKKLLKAGGVCIPSRITSFAAPLQSSKLYEQLKKAEHLKPDGVAFESPYYVKPMNCFAMAAPQELFKFEYPNLSNASNSRYSQVCYDVRADSNLHGFALYLEYQLYKEIKISTVPTSQAASVYSIFPVFIPLLKPIQLQEGDKLTLHFWRNVSRSRVWYEWAVTEPQAGPVHNPGGRSSHLSLSPDV